MQNCPLNKKRALSRQKVSDNRTFQLLTLAYTAVLLFFALIACFFSYKQKKEELLSRMDMTYLQLEQEYTDILDNFWQIYMPIYEDRGSSGIHAALENYFVTSRDTALSPLDKSELISALSQMMTRSSDIQWIALYEAERPVNYILFNTGARLQEMPEDFPYLEKLASASSRMEVYGMEPVSNAGSPVYAYAICGGVPVNMGTGKILVGYCISSLEQICSAGLTALPSLNYRLTANNDILFDSGGCYSENAEGFPADNREGIVRGPDGARYYLRSKISGNKDSVIRYTVHWKEMFRYAHSYTLPILLVVFLFAGLSILLYTAVLRLIAREVDMVRTGLDELGENHLDYRIPTDFHQSGLPEIAESINHMAARLHDNINRAYYYELKQREAELAELQAKFNPHFLYNTLEMLRSRCMQSGDEQTAELITQLAAIFRGFIGSRTFIPLQEELAFSKRYLALFGARYGDRVQVRYDIETPLLKYGIIRNVFQPLIENYFVHGFDSSGECNYILFRGKALDDGRMLLSVEDNGSGMTGEEIESLKARLREPVQMDTESYGLKNLHQRLQLFYGEQCGLDIVKNGEKGICIRMTLKMMTCAEYEADKANNAAPDGSAMHKP